MNEVFGSTLMGRVVAKVDSKDFRGALELLEDLIKVEGTREQWQLYGLVWKECGNDAKAREALLKVVELDPDKPRAWINLGAIELDLELFAEATQHYQRAVELEPERVDYRVWLANAFSRAGDVDKALEAYDQAQMLDPMNAEIFNERAICNRNHGNFKAAERDFRRAYALDPARKHALESAEGMSVAGHLQPSNTVPAAMGDDDRHDVAVLSAALEKEPGNAIYFNNRGWAYWRLGNAQAALSDFDSALAIEPDYLQAKVNQAAVLGKLGRRKESESAMRDIVRLDPTYAHGLYNLSAHLIETDRFDEALPLIERAIVIDSADADFYVIRGTILERLERRQEALSDFTRAIGMQPTHAKAHFMRGNMQFDLGRPKTAIGDYTRALQFAPDNAMAHLNRGLCHAQLEGLSDARADLERALELFPYLVIAHLSLADIASRENRTDDASRHLAAAESLGYTDTEGR